MDSGVEEGKGRSAEENVLERLAELDGGEYE